MRLYIALVHYPVLDCNSQTVTSSITNLDIHDFARTALTFEVERAYMVTPVTQQRDLVEYIRNTWVQREGTGPGTIRSRALSLLSAVPSVEAAQQDIRNNTGESPFTVTTSANPSDDALTFSQMTGVIKDDNKPSLLLFGTGWGLTSELHDAANARLEPLRAKANYNHLPVRAAMAMILDRLVPEQTAATHRG